MRFLVTGGTGFIGRRLVAHLVAQHGASAITCLVKAPTKPSEVAALTHFEQLGITILRGDLTHTPVCDSAPPRVEVVFHLAANIDTDTPESEHRVNDQGTANLLDWLTPALAGCRIVYTSSVAVIDRAGLADGPMREDTPCTPRTPYGITKLRGEQILRDRAARGGYTWTILRLATVYGPGGKRGGMFDLLISAARKGTLISRLNWPGRTSILFIEDAVAVLHDMASQPDAANQLFMVSSGEACTVADISREAGEIVGRSIRPIRLPAAMWGAIRAVTWHPIVRGAVPRSARVSYWRLSLIVDDGFWCDPVKLLETYRKPMVRLAEGLRRTIAPNG